MVKEGLIRKKSIIGEEKVLGKDRSFRKKRLFRKREIYCRRRKSGRKLLLGKKVLWANGGRKFLHKVFRQTTNPHHMLMFVFGWEGKGGRVGNPENLNLQFFRRGAGGLRLLITTILFGAQNPKLTICFCERYYIRFLGP